MSKIDLLVESHSRLFAGGLPATIRNMRWLLHGSLHPSVGDALRRHEQVATVADANLPPAEMFEFARKQQLEIITADATLTDSLFAGEIPFRRLIVHLNVEPGEVEQDDAVDRLFARYSRLTAGHLYTVTASRVKVRQLPTTRRLAKP
jgi:predicted nuclease of predicted toxin-antitoxin system